MDGAQLTGRRRVARGALTATVAALAAMAAAPLGAGGCGGRLFDDLGPNGATGDGGPDAAADHATPGAECSASNKSACAKDEWCQYTEPGACGRAGGVGSCTPRPTVCPSACPGVCGCDGNAYCNPCEAERAGTDVAHGTACVPQGGDYAAYVLYTNVPRMALFKSDAARDVCFRIILVYTDQPKLFGIQTPQGWGVERAEITNAASDCAMTSTGDPVTPRGTTLGAAGGDGTIAFPDDDAGAPGTTPCSVAVHVRLAFDPGAFTWAPGTEPLDADALTIAGACK